MFYGHSLRLIQEGQLSVSDAEESWVLMKTYDNYCNIHVLKKSLAHAVKKVSILTSFACLYSHSTMIYLGFEVHVMGTKYIVHVLKLSVLFVSCIVNYVFDLITALCA